MKSRLLFVVAIALLVVALSAMSAPAGDLNPPGTPAPTMKTLDQIPPTWDQVIPDAADRFKLVMGGAAVLDKETGLVWEKVLQQYNLAWGEAVFVCYQRLVGGRTGWRLPAVEEIFSLIDVTHTFPALPPGHPFILPPAYSSVWSASTDAFDSSLAWSVDLFAGMLVAGNKSSGPARLAWCVRGGRGHDAR